mmetsp:Transcript_57915/g.113969  ORF Transcript_57915/g.113969 Transcript_57915/m.113969 type:complete len:307 (-) Transcript_57915:725-1645(-)
MVTASKQELFGSQLGLASQVCVANLVLREGRKGKHKRALAGSGHEAKGTQQPRRVVFPVVQEKGLALSVCLRARQANSFLARLQLGRSAARVVAHVDEGQDATRHRRTTTSSTAAAVNPLFASFQRRCPRSCCCCCCCFRFRGKRRGHFFSSSTANAVHVGEFHGAAAHKHKRPGKGGERHRWRSVERAEGDGVGGGGSAHAPSPTAHETASRIRRRAVGQKTCLPSLTSIKSPAACSILFHLAPIAAINDLVTAAAAAAAPLVVDPGHEECIVRDAKPALLSSHVGCELAVYHGQGLQASGPEKE